MFNRSNKKRTAYLHIGLEKTGTTSIQEFLHINRDQLYQQHKLYFPKSPGLKNHIHFPLYAYGKNLGDLPLQKGLTDPEKLAAFRTAFKQDFFQEVKPILNTGSDLLISNEHLSSRVADEADIQKLVALFKELNAQIKVIVYFRRQDKFLISTYSTWVKCGGKQNINMEAYKKPRYDYLHQLNMWGNVLGKENIEVGIFEKSRWKEGSLYLDFCSKIGITSLADLEIPEATFNQSLDKDQIKFLLPFNRLVPEYTKEGRNPLRGDIVEVLEKHSGKEKLKFPNDHIQKINTYFQADNQTIIKEYLKEEIDTLFPLKESETIQKDAAEEEGLTTQKAIEIAALLWEKQQFKINRLRRLWRELEAKIKALEQELEEKRSTV